MKRRTRVLGIVGLVVIVLLGMLAITVSHDSPCPTAPLLAEGSARMQAIVYRCYGDAKVLRLEEVAKPDVGAGQVLVKVRAASINPLDWHYMRGEPYLMRMSVGYGAPRQTGLGTDFAGTVEAVGPAVTRFKVGDAVFGGRRGSLSEYVTLGETSALASKPENMSFEQAASVPIAAITALQALRDKGQLQPGQKVLINGASGGVGTFAVQIAKSLGAEVTGVCSTRNVELVRSLGADHVIDYKTTDFTAGSERYDLILDTVSNHPLAALRGVLQPTGKLVIIGAQSDDPWLGAMSRPLAAALQSPFVDQQMIFILADLNATDLTKLAELMQAGKVTPVIDRTFALRDTAEAIHYVETGRARGKVVVTMN